MCRRYTIDDSTRLLEKVNKLNTKRRGRNVAFKLDRSQTYVSLSWDIHLAVMRRLGFSDKWCLRIMRVVRSDEILVKINEGHAAYLGLEEG